MTPVEFGNIKAAKEVLQSGKIAAVFVEPIQVGGGVQIVVKEFLERHRRACDDAGALLVFDEVKRRQYEPHIYIYIYRYMRLIKH